MSRPGARVPSSALYICPTALHTAFYSVVQCYWTYALSLVWQGRIGRSEAHSAMLESRHRRDGPISLTTAVVLPRQRVNSAASPKVAARHELWFLSSGQAGRRAVSARVSRAIDPPRIVASKVVLTSPAGARLDSSSSGEIEVEHHVYSLYQSSAAPRAFQLPVFAFDEVR